MPFNYPPGGHREQRSLFGEILDWMLAPLLLLWPVSVLLTWLVAQGIANRPYDRELVDRARMLAGQIAVAPAASGEPEVRFSLPGDGYPLLRVDETDDLYYQVLGLRGELLSGTAGIPRPPEDRSQEAGLMQLRDDEVFQNAVRVAYLWVQPTGAPGQQRALVQVAETLGKRSALATEIIKGVILPQFVLLPLAVLLVWLALVRGIAPLAELQQRIRRRESTDLSPIDDHDAPEEVGPLVRAINDLLERLDQSIGMQKHFLADAAHQLKTPLAGLRMQAELAQREIDAGRRDPEQLKLSLQQIAHSSQRAAHMVNQLLALARAEDKEQVLARQPLQLAPIAFETVRDFVPRALDKQIDLGYEGPDASRPGLQLLGQPVLLRELIRNLVDNALQYTPRGGTVTVRVVDDPFGQVVVLQVEDDGPGIPAAEREQVFRPFYRALGTDVDGSGLGLAIVHEIAQQHEAELLLEDAHPRPSTSATRHEGGVGARFTVRFRAVATDAGVDTVPAAIAD